MITHINAEVFKRMFLTGANNLDSKKELINELNVFPVPDGDTGTNMTMTIMAAAKEVAALDNPDMMSLCKSISSGSLRGARGNSGVILSQIFRGLTKVLAEYDEINVEILARACEKGCKSAYKAVMKPKEGTILTVAKGMADRAALLAQEKLEDLDVFMQEVIKAGEETLASTPDMLPVLKQAGVVDSGGQGLMEVVKGAYDGLMGREVDYTVIAADIKSAEQSKALEGMEIPEEDIKFGYCTEFIVMLDKTFNHKHEKDLKSYLESIGDSIVVVSDEDIVKVHVHTNNPGMAIQRGLLYGQLSNMKIDNMRLEHQERLFRYTEGKPEELPLESDTYQENLNTVSNNPEGEVASSAAHEEPKKDYGFIAVSVGEGLTSIFSDLGVDMVIAGGQTMNPSTEDFVDAINKINAETIFILPNNKNIILAASQAQYLVEGKKPVVIPTKTVAQGITSLIGFSADKSPEENERRMTEAIHTVKTGEVTYAVRDTTIGDKAITAGDYMGIGDSGILSVGKDLEETVMNMIEAMVDENTELISIYYGEEIEEDKAAELASLVEERFDSCDVELQNGGQPIYYYIISAE